MVSHAVPGVVGLQKLHRHLGLLQQLPMKMGIRYSAFNGLLGTSFSKNSLKPISSTSRKSGVKQYIFMDTREFTSTTTPSASAAVAVFTILLVSIHVHLADTMSYTNVIRQRVLQHKASHAEIASI